MEIIEPPKESALRDAISILEIVGDAKKAKKLIDELSELVRDSAPIFDSIKKEEIKLSAVRHSSKLAESEAERINLLLDKKKQGFLVEEKRIEERLQQLNRIEQDLQKRETGLKNFEADLRSMESTLRAQADQFAVEQRASREKQDSIIKEYEEKTKKLKAVLG